MLFSAFMLLEPLDGGCMLLLPGIVVFVQLGVVDIVGVCDVVVPVLVGFVLVTGVPGVVALLVFVVVPLLTVDDVVVPFVVVAAFGVLFGDVFVVVLDVPGGQLGSVVLVVDGVVVVVGGVVVLGVVVLGVVVVGVVCANAGTAILTTSPATEARLRMARELMRLCSPRKPMYRALLRLPTPPRKYEEGAHG